MNSNRLRSYWLSAYLCAAAGDWLQGPYLYSVYRQRGFSDGVITALSALGFLSSALLGAFVASLANTGNRQRYALTAILLYVAACGLLLIGGTSIWALVLGKLASGIATALWSPFYETWLIGQQLKYNLPNSWLDTTLSLAASLNGIIAIAAGLAGDALILWWHDTLEMPFVAALIALIVSALLVCLTWSSEGPQTTKSVSVATKSNSFYALFKDSTVIYLCFIQILFESAMYTFVFFWAPILQQRIDKDQSLPFGSIFAIFMASYALGPVFYRQITGRASNPWIYASLFATAGLCLSLASYSTLSVWTTAIALAVFEFHCGLYAPWSARWRSKYIPETMRGTATSLVTGPMNLIVAAILLTVSEITTTTNLYTL
ncbi:hypothetical protein BDF19DRAFT_429161 [Syncephalis fuscata]|nr:hypothetical protein BDF19DRAFT_429161 [Syncephalis fuscata]